MLNFSRKKEGQRPSGKMHTCNTETGKTHGTFIEGSCFMNTSNHLYRAIYLETLVFGILDFGFLRRESHPRTVSITLPYQRKSREELTQDFGAGGPC